MAYQYVWLIWSSAFLLPWLLLYARFPRHRVPMWRSSLVMAPFGSAEPLFVPEYWKPPSLFKLAQKTGFDIERVIFSFAIGDIAAVLNNVILHKQIDALELAERPHWWHRRHRWALATPFALFPILYFLPWNPIHAGIAAMLLGAIAAVLCRPDLKSNADQRNIVSWALRGFPAGAQVVSSRLPRTSVDFRGTDRRANLRLAARGTVARLFIWAHVDGDT